MGRKTLVSGLARRTSAGALSVMVAALGACSGPGAGTGPRAAGGAAPPPATAGRRAEPSPETAATGPRARLRDPQWTVRRDAAKALAGSADPEAHAALAAALGDPHPAVREAAYTALKGLGGAAAPAVSRAFATGAGEQRAKAKLLLGILGAEALPALRTIYGARTTAPRARQALVTFAGTILEARAVTFLIAALDDPAHPVREAAGRALLQRTDESEVGRMLAAFRRATGRQRQALVEVFTALRDPRVPAALLATFAKERRTLRRHNRLDALLRHPGGHARALAALAAPDPAVRRAMLGALAYEVSSLARVTQAAWVTAERQRFLKAFQTVRAKILPPLRAVLRGKDPEQAFAAAQVLQFLKAHRSLRPQQDAVIAHLRQRLAGLHGASHAPERVVHHARLGFLYWERSCKRPDPLSLCMRSRRVAKRGEPPHLVRELLPRDARLVKLAQTHFRAAWVAWADGAAAKRVSAEDPQRARRIGRARHYAAWAKFMEAELGLEAFLKQGLPHLRKPAATATGADGALRAARTQLAAWYRVRMATARRLEATYRAAMGKVVAEVGGHRGGSIYWRLASLSRVGTVYLEFAHQLKEIHAPPWLPRGAARTAFEQDYLAVVDRFEATARTAYLACLDTAARTRTFWDLALHCEAELMTADPEAYAEWAGDRRARLTRIPPPAAERRVPTAEEVRHVVRSRQAKVQACFAKHLAGERRAESGTLVVRFRIEVDGKVTVITMTGLNAPDTEACVRGIYAGIRFPVAPPRPVEASYRYHHRPSHQVFKF